MGYEIFVGKYFGRYKIVNVKKAERKTYLGANVLELELETLDIGKTLKREFPEAMVSNVATEQPKDPSTLRELMVEPVASEVLGLLANSELTIEDIKYLINTKIPLSVEDIKDKAYKLLWGKENYEVTLADIERVLSNARGEKNNNGTSSKRSVRNRKVEKKV